MANIENSEDITSVRRDVARILSNAADKSGYVFDPQSVALAVREEGRTVAGLTGTTNWDWLYIETLAVEPAYRGQGFATQLVTKAESIALSRGCVGAWVDTFTFQAPEFYIRLGYEQFGVLPQYPEGQSRVFLRKLFAS